MGLSMPEIAVRDIIDTAIAAFRTDDALLNYMLEDLAAGDRESLRTALATRSPKVRLGWSRESEEDWSIAVTLAGTDPTHTIGNVVSDLDESAYDVRDLATAIGNEAETTLDLDGTFPTDLPARGIVLIGDEYATFRVDAGPVVVLEARGIRGTTAVAHLSGVEVRFVEFSERIGWSDLVHLRVDILGSNAAFVVALSYLLRAYIQLQRGAFETAGMTLADIRMTDLAPRPAMLPADLYVRTLPLDVRVETALPEVVPAVTKTEVELTPENMEATLGTSIPLTI